MVARRGDGALARATRGMKSICASTLALACLLPPAVPKAWAAVASSDATFGSNDTTFTLRPGEYYTLPMPQTKYPGSPFDVTLVDTSMTSFPDVNWVIKLTVSRIGNALSWISVTNGGNGELTGSAQVGGPETIMSFFKITEGHEIKTAAALDAVSVGSNEVMRLSIPSVSPIREQTFILSETSS